jgi:3-methyladenine DNA glycosylase Tag
MVAAPRPRQLQEDLAATNLPGHSVDALLAAGNIDGARAEFERLCLEGLDSGDPVRMTLEKWQEFRLDLHRKAKLAS